MNQQQFEEARLKVLSQSNPDGGIGTLSEKSVHAVLKAYYEPYEDSREVKVGSYVADIVGENGILEIQTRQFSRLNKKLNAFLPLCHVTVVYPILAEKWIVTVNLRTGAALTRRKSPLHGSLWNLLEEMRGIQSFFGNPALSFRAVLLEAEEIRAAGKGCGKGKKIDLIPLRLIEEYAFSSPADFYRILPPDLPAAFTSSMLAQTARIPLPLAQTGLYVLHRLGCVARIGKQGKSVLYQISTGL